MFMNNMFLKIVIILTIFVNNMLLKNSYNFNLVYEVHAIKTIINVEEHSCHLGQKFCFSLNTLS